MSTTHVDNELIALLRARSVSVSVLPMAEQISSIPTDRPVYSYEVLIREAHLDTFGHVNNAVYLALFEEARWQIITERGYGLKEVHERKIGPTILDVRVQFRRELKNREKITIKSWNESHQGKITKFKQVMINSKGEEACIADFTIALFDLQARKLIVPTPEWRHALGLPAES